MKKETLTINEQELNFTTYRQTYKGNAEKIVIEIFAMIKIKEYDKNCYQKLKAK